MLVGYCQLVTISTDNLLETNEFRNGVGAHWPFLSDRGRTSPLLNAIARVSPA